ncbi:MAG: hypothetical protein WDN04_16665 [Rhodospirillales bacterium]
MKSVLRACMLAALLVVAAPARALPVSGYWWNPAEGGRGFVIEIEGSALYFAGFLYDSSGARDLGRGERRHEQHHTIFRRPGRLFRRPDPHRKLSGSRAIAASG